jgi:hypothetical protein
MVVSYIARLNIHVICFRMYACVAAAVGYRQVEPRCACVFTTHQCIVCVLCCGVDRRHFGRDQGRLSPASVSQYCSVSCRLLTVNMLSVTLWQSAFPVLPSVDTSTLIAWSTRFIARTCELRSGPVRILAENR